MIAHARVGDYLSNTCRHCNRIVRSRVVRKSVKLARTRLVVRDVLVDECPDCGHMISIAADSIEQMREAGSWK
jgi:hypothetical protein